MNAIVNIANGRVVADSRDVAEAFGKLHKHVLRDIDNLLSMRPELRSKFGPQLFDVINPANGAKRAYRRYDMTRTGFMLLVMGFSGQKALALKLDWLAAFESMQATLQAVADGGPDVAPILDMEEKRAALAFVREARLLGGRAAGRRAWDLVGLPNVFDKSAPALPGAAAVSDVVLRWFNERVEEAQGERTRTMTLFADFSEWSGEAMALRNFAAQLSGLGIASIRSNGIWRLDVRLRS